MRKKQKLKKRLQEMLNKRYKQVNTKLKEIEYQYNNIIKWIDIGKKEEDLKKKANKLLDKFHIVTQLYGDIKTYEVDSISKRFITTQKFYSDIEGKIKSIQSKLNLNDRIIEQPKAQQEVSKVQNKSNLQNSTEGVIHDRDGNVALVYPVNEKRSLWTTLKDKFFPNTNQPEKKSKLSTKIAAVAMASIVAIFGSGNIYNVAKGEGDNEENKITYTDNEKEMNRNKQEENKNVKIEKPDEGQKEIENTHTETITIKVPAGIQYTEVSDGSGKMGYFSKDTQVSIYNRAFIRTNPDGTKSILQVTKLGETWEEYAKEKGIDYQEFQKYIEQNENIQEMIAIKSIDGKNIYGWIPSSQLEYSNGKSEIANARYYMNQTFDELQKEMEQDR